VKVQLFAMKRHHDMHSWKTRKKLYLIAIGLLVCCSTSIQSVNAADPALMKIMFERAQQRYEQGQYAQALKDLETVRKTYPEDPAVRYLYAGCKLALGDAEAARLEYSILLQQQTDYVEAYLGRALAHAKLGDSRRAHDDLATAERLNPKAAAKIKPLVEKELGGLDASMKQAPGALLNDLERAAREGTSEEQLIAAAARLHTAMNARRLRSYEDYQQRLRELEAAVKAAPRDPDRLAALGKFVYSEAIRNTQVFMKSAEPRAPVTIFRYQTPEQKDREIAQAEAALDQAIKINPNHVQALTWKAAAYARKGQWDNADQFVDRALAVPTKSPDVDLLEMKKHLVDQKASQLLSAAADLRSIKQWSTFEGFGLDVREIIHTRTPTPEELAKAEAFERQARSLGNVGDRMVDLAAKSQAGTAEGYFYAGLLQARLGNYAAAKDQYLQAIKLSPKMFRAHDALSLAYRKLGMPDEAFKESTLALNISHTTAEPLLRASWDPLRRTAWKHAQELLDQARALDPDDPRIPAYHGILLEATGRPEEALIDFRMVLAMEEARARAHGTTIRPGGTGIRDPEEFGRPLAIRLRMGAIHMKLNNFEEAVQLCRDNIALMSRVDENKWKSPVWSAMLPVPNADPDILPAEIPVGRLFAQSYLGAAYALVMLNRPDEATAEVEQAKKLLGRENSEVLRAEGQIAVIRARDALEHGNTLDAYNLLRRAGHWPEVVELRQRINAALAKEEDEQRGRLQHKRSEPPKAPTSSELTDILRQKQEEELHHK
jgi:tetratricopeptide (TPR) repeat protein